ncbi:glycosyl hydrolase [Aeoliella sp. SH292]|uniref:glycosyl hydrolase n=1 Tax=Aeoliella sp. SH292 TaxID=3454464 RepID=UPI003F983640
MSRVHCWWWWLNGNVTKEAITRDLEAMKAKGMGGANIIDAAHASQNENRKPPHGPDFASPAWCEMFVHALREAERLDLELGFNIQSGWNLGGPSVTPHHAAKEITWSKIVVEGGKLLQMELPQPETRNDYYCDISVLALPLPADKELSLARVDNYRQKAYHDYPGNFIAADATHLLEVGESEGEVVVDRSAIQDLTDKLGAHGQLEWDAPPGRWLILRFGYTPSGAHVSTSSDNWKGLAIDYLDAGAFEQYCDDVLTPILKVAKPYVGKSLKFLHTDSWELGPVNWTSALPDEFVSRRGYDLTTYLPVVAGYVVDDAETSNRFLADFRRTIAEMIADGKYRAFAKYAHERGLGIHPESGGPHAAPVDALLNLGLSDIPMGEFWARSRTHRVEDSARLFVKQPASAAHIYGKRLVMAEAFTTIGPHWEKDPRDLKPVFDQVACEGLNLVMWHTFDCSPIEAGYPGNAYFAGTHLNPQVTWWDQCDGFIGYLNRSQFLLQQGVPVSDVLYFYGENVPSFVRLKADNPALVPRGYDYDVVNLEVLAERATVNDGRIILPDGTSYAILVLPPSGHYGLAALREIARLADAGATIYGEKPAAPIGLIAEEEDRREFNQLAARLWGEKLIEPVRTRTALRRRGIEPDFSYSSLTDARLDYFHRQTNDSDIYFVVNRDAESKQVTASFRVDGRTTEIWDAVDGTITMATNAKVRGGRTEVELDLPAEGSVFIVLRDDPTPATRAGVERVATSNTSILGPWQVTFDPRWGGPEEPVQFDTLEDWSKSADPRIRYYSGTAIYEISLTHSGKLDTDEELWLDLGAVKNLARVHLNNTDLGVVWCDPPRVNVTDAIREGDNQLRIEVVNLWPNRLIGDAKLPRSERLTKTNIVRFANGDMPLLPSGLLGPVELVRMSPARAEQITGANGSIQSAPRAIAN